ncbi:transglutaminase domain-containing protein [Paenalkalicoccus suaedae]|uniref:Transglutaminase domain-containing protein n=1 Tax=Paenalkalicoccus suaedae TaxID=2592382 RepID=A0A859FBG9_9BACI|nr:transglutaminase-like domain-containing protein [Paenalkalicoccus suaedae]QKS70031.1 transglutaminase domain-containing protein [Paenalkalicoccus suaedae]
MNVTEHYYKTVHYDYSFKNRQKETVHYWLADPPETTTQRNIRCTDGNDIGQLSTLHGQTIRYVELAPGEKIELSFSIDLYKCTHNHEGNPMERPPTLSDEERAFYLRSSAMQPVNEEFKEEALGIIGEAQSDYDQAKALFDHFVRRFRYHFPPEKRGARYMAKRKSGDCGEFSFLYASYCRALGIPCRTVVGAWARKMQPHVWNEVFIEGVGWMPVDTSVPAMYRNPYRRLTSPMAWGVPSKVDGFFGSSEGNRVAFSLDANWPLTPEYVDQMSPCGYERMDFGIEKFAYGFEAHDSTAPYLQPGYVQFQEMPKKQALPDLLGNWRVRDEGQRRVTQLSLDVFAMLLVLTLLVSGATALFLDTSFPPEPWYQLTLSFAGAMLILAKLLRQEGHPAVLVPFFLFSGFVFYQSVSVLMS